MRLICVNLCILWILFNGSNNKVAHQTTHLKKWFRFVEAHKKRYATFEEEKNKINVFLKNDQYIEEFNSDKSNSVKLKMNHFGDLTNEEFAGQADVIEYIETVFQRRKMFVVDPKHSNFTKLYLSENFDWRHHNVLGEVRNQGNCGSCYAFGSSAYAIKHGTNLKLSAQQIMDCTSIFGNRGCEGGDHRNVYLYLMNFYAMKEEDYQYQSKKSRCKYNATLGVFKVSEYQHIRAGDEEHLLLAIRTQGPVAVAMDAKHSSFQFYSSGVYSSKNCYKKKDELNHIVTAIGYGTDEKTNETYFVIQNSFGSDWGEMGYMRIARNRKNQCGLATDAVVPIV